MQRNTCFDNVWLKGREEYYKEVIDGALKTIKVRDYLTPSVRQEFNICEYNSDFFRKIHSPNTIEEVGETQRRLIFDDLFYFASRLYREERETPISDFVIERTDMVKQIISELPFILTEDQRTTVDKIIENAKEGNRINALVQGDVGCGKTIVSFLSMVAFAENGYQSALMAPTQVLAKQHYEGLTSLVSKYGLRVAYLHSGMKVREKKKVCDDIKTGWYHFVVGTHSVFANSVEYYNLGLVITDEEHKFGVEQRDSLVEKASNGVHTITMSATPIPRTLAITLYGESKEVFTINQMPSGRKPVITGIAKSDERTFSFMRSTIAKGQQCYVVCPLIKDSDSEKMEGVESVENIYSRLVEYFEDDDTIKIEMLTGKQSSEEVEETIGRFSRNETQVLISTTVIEVGVNVPNASVIVIRNAATDILRKEKRLIIDHEAKYTEISDVENIETISDYNLLKKAISSLSDKEQEILYLRCIMNMSFREIGNILNIKEGTARQRMSEARNSLMKKIKGEDYV